MPNNATTAKILRDREEVARAKEEQEKAVSADEEPANTSTYLNSASSLKQLKPKMSATARKKGIRLRRRNRSETGRLQRMR